MNSNPVVGVVGAFERDNFGDLLFLERTRRFLDGADLEALPLSPFRGVPEQFTNERTPAFIDAVNGEALDALWVVGGEIGGVLIHAAYRMLDPHSQDEKFASSRRHTRRQIIRAKSGLAVTDFAYLPRPSKYPEVRSVPFVINSAGVSGIAQLSGGVRADAIGALKDADFISVRENASSSLLTELGVEHSLAPDLVHTLRFDYPEYVGQQFRDESRDRRVAVVQMSAATLNSAGVDALVSFLGTSDSLRGYEIRLLAAGLAPGHDSLDLYKRVVEGVESKHPHVAISISPAASALDKVREIASSSVVIATSLHAMIISMAFDVPHVGLYLEKIARYSRAWKDIMPTAVALENADSAVEFALSNGQKVIDAGFGEELATKAQTNMTAALSVVRAGLGVETKHSRAAARTARDRQLRRESLTPSRIATSSLRSILRPLS